MNFKISMIINDNQRLCFFLFYVDLVVFLSFNLKFHKIDLNIIFKSAKDILKNNRVQNKLSHLSIEVFPFFFF